MTVWGKIKKEDRIVKDVVVAGAGFEEALFAVCDHFDLSRPILCEKHINEIRNFGMTIFYPDDFIDPVAFDTLELETISNRKKRR